MGGQARGWETAQQRQIELSLKSGLWDTSSKCFDFHTSVFASGKWINNSSSFVRLIVKTERYFI